MIISPAPDLSGSGRVDMPTRPVALAGAAVATGASGYIDTRQIFYTWEEEEEEEEEEEDQEEEECSTVQNSTVQYNTARGRGGLEVWALKLYFYPSAGG